MNSILKVSIKAAVEAGKSILEIYNSDLFDIDFKNDGSPLTRADMASNKIIKSYLSETKFPILSEEDKIIPFKERKKWDRLWIVDPLDGTKEFIKRNDEFTVNIAFIENQNTLAGVIYAPALDLLYFSYKELGAFKASIDINNNVNIDNLISNATRLPVPRNDKLFTIVASRSHMSNETEEFTKKMHNKHKQIKLISKGSSLKFCMVAEGKADCYPRFAPTMEWDTAAGQSICENAGYQVIDLKNNKKMLYNRENLLNNSFLVT